MQYFNYLLPRIKETLFLHSPTAFDRTSPRELLAYALGATLYMPATREEMFREIMAYHYQGLISMVICLEDGIGDNEVESAEKNAVQQLKQLFARTKTGEIPNSDIPLLFVRVRDYRQMVSLVNRLEEAVEILTGFIFPKFSPTDGGEYFRELDRINHQLTRPLYGLPILETSDVIYRETRIGALSSLKQILDHYYDLVLNVRIGATDFSSLFGIRRGCDVTIYDIAVIRDCIADIINVFSRADNEYVISGPVWEYFSRSSGRVLKPQLRQSPFEQELGQSGRELRTQMLDQYIDGLIREVLLDKANGLTGKTIIHPSHIKPVQALNVVTHEEYQDACTIIANNNGNFGVIKSNYANKMNEIKPHLTWAKKILAKSRIYGVFNENHNFTSLLV